MPRLSALLAAAITLAIGAHTPTLAAPKAPAADTVTTTRVAAPARLTARQPDSILRAEEAAKTDLDYTAGEGETYYFDADGKPADKAAAGGYYRKTLGKTADGRLVVQDYYQDGDKPQTAPVILKKGADPRNFASDKVNDSKTVWYRKDGSVKVIQDFKKGTATGRNRYYQNGILALETGSSTLEEDDPYRAAGDVARGARFYYPDGKILALGDMGATGNTDLLCYREDGSPMMRIRTKGGEAEFSAWDSAGKPATREAVANEAQAAMRRILRLITDVQNEA